MDETMIKIKGLTFGYGSKKPLFYGFGLTLEAGKIVGLLGRNGTGKSTLLYLICGLLHPRSGKLRFKGIDVSRNATAMLEDIYLVPEEFALPDVTMRQYVKLNSPFYPKFSGEMLHAFLSDFDLDDTVRLGELSMGQKKKAFMSFALATNTSLLLMDEPTNGLDIPSKSQFRKVVSSGMTDGRTIVISTHQVQDINRLLDHIVIIEGAQLLLDESVQTITEKLCFVEQGLNEPTDGALYVQPSVRGNSVVKPNLYGEETPLDLELLFNAMLAEGKEMRKVFGK